MANKKVDVNPGHFPGLADPVKQELECPICLEQLKEPKVLSCLHTFCMQCLETLALRPKDDVDEVEIICPVCRTKTQIPENGVSALKSNFVVHEMIEVLNLQSNAVTGGMVCYICEGDDIVTCLCNECRYFLCTVCASYHKRAKVTRNHKLFSIEEDENLDLKELISCRKSKPKYCLKHDDGILNLYCENCKEVSCRDCILIDHKMHQYSFIKEIVKQRKERLNEKMNTSKKLLSEIQGAEHGIREMIKKVNAKEKEITNEVKESYDNAIRQINARVEELYKEIHKIADKKIKALDAQLLNFSLLSDAISFADSILKHCDDIEIMEMDNSVQNRLDNLCNGLSDVSPVEGDEISIYPDCSESTATLSTAIDNHIPSIKGYSFEPEKCSVSIVGQNIDPERTFSFRITTKTKDATICGSQFDYVCVYIKEDARAGCYSLRGPHFRQCRAGKEILCKIQTEEGHSMFTGKIPYLSCHVNYHLYLSLNAHDVRYLRIIFKWQGTKFDVEPTFQKV